MKQKLSKGFTLIELLVVISIIGILATLVLANLNSARQRGRDAQRKSDLRSIQEALQLYYNDFNKYPDSMNKVDDYMPAVPDDPIPAKDYVYARIDLDSYTLTACLENKSDEDGEDDSGSGMGCDSGWMYQVKQE